MKKILLQLENISKSYNRKNIFQNVAFSISTGSSFAITGKNGSGKSTLIKIICGVLAPSQGRVQLFIDENRIVYPEFYPYIGLVSPYLNMYEEFTAEENLWFMAKMRNMKSHVAERSNLLLQKFGIYEHRKKEVRHYSSGMKQRLKYCAALLHQPYMLVLDEPTSNLDENGIQAVRDIMEEQKQRGLLIFGTNEKDDLEYADGTYSLDTAAFSMQNASI